MVGRLGHLLPKTSFKIRWNYQNFQYFWELRFRNKWKVAIIRFHLTHETNIRKIHGIGEESEEICCKLQTISEIFGTSWPANGLSVSSIRNSIKRKTVAFPSVHHSYISISTSQLHFHQYITATFRRLDDAVKLNFVNWCFHGVWAGRVEPTRYAERCVPAPVFTSVDKSIRRIMNTDGQIIPR